MIILTKISVNTILLVSRVYRHNQAGLFLVKEFVVGSFTFFLSCINKNDCDFIFHVQVLKQIKIQTVTN